MLKSVFLKPGARQILVINIIYLTVLTSSGLYSNTWAINVKGGRDEVLEVVNRYGLQLLDQVRYYIDILLVLWH